MKAGLIINKPPGITSHDVIYQLRKLPQLQNLKIGHSGTLDPFATGVLLVLLGNAVRLQDELHVLPKTYRAEITLGKNTDTDDATGKRLTSPNPSFVRRGIREVLLSFRRRGLGEVRSEKIPSKTQILSALDTIKDQTTQIPPNYSAIKINGKKMYDLARKGEIVEQKPRNITIHDIALETYSYPKLTISVTCSTGTYIRAIARDIGSILGTGGYCSRLERTAIGNFTIQRAVQLQSIPENINSVLISLEQLTEHLESISFNDLNVAKLKNGREVEAGENTPINIRLVLKNSDNKVFGIGIRESEALFIKPKKIFL
ncbi:MAG TPA: tRNA pseudouridine(55) synthase TruB [Candidatus Andersenbacteria bacterium]|nr:tRNA pseudouridine(55) synthase TruB [Candidatus Andersenbacteria bacterium]